MSYSISKPEQSTWWIFYNDGYANITNGSTETNQVTTTGLANQEVFTVEDDYITRCGELGINLDET